MPAKYVLIADADQKTLVKLEESLREIDVHVSVAADGAQALERALTVRQDLFLFSDKLPVIDTPKLAEILRANPRTANVPLVLLRSAEGAGAYGDGALAKPVQREAVVNTVLKFAFKVGTPQDGGDKLSGLLAEMPVADLLQVMRANRREGMLEIAGPVAGTIWIRRGEIVDARAGKAEGPKALFRLLDAREGKFTFKAAKVARQAVFEEGLDTQLMEAARQRDEVDRLRRDRPLSGRLVLLRELTALPEGLHPVHRELLLLAEFYGEVQEVVDNARVPELEAHLGLRSLVDAGILGAVGAPGKDAAAGIRVEPALMVYLKNMAGHSPRRLRPVRVAVVASASSLVSEIYELFPAARWIKNQDRVLGNQLRVALDGEFILQLDFFPPGSAFANLYELPAGLLAGGVIVAATTDDKELDFLNDSAAALRAKGLPVEIVLNGGDQAVDWMRKAFDVAADAPLHRIQRGAFTPLIEAVRAVLVRRAASSGWSVGAR